MRGKEGRGERGGRVVGWFAPCHLSELRVRVTVVGPLSLDCAGAARAVSSSGGKVGGEGGGQNRGQRIVHLWRWLQARNGAKITEDCPVFEAEAGA